MMGWADGQAGHSGFAHRYGAGNGGDPGPPTTHRLGLGGPGVLAPQDLHAGVVRALQGSAVGGRGGGAVQVSGPDQGPG